MTGFEMSMAAGSHRESGRGACRPAGSLGAALVEFAIILPVMLIILLGIIDLGRVFYTYEALANAAREGARRCALYSPCDDAWARTQVEDELDGRVAVTGATVTYPLGMRSGGHPVQVTVTSSFVLVTPLMDNLITGPLTLQAAAEMPVW